MNNSWQTEIHPTAVVDPETHIGKGTVIGPYCVIEGGVTLGENCHLKSHVVLHRGTHLGNRVRVYPFAVLGGDPQHLKHNGEPTSVEIHDNVVLRESVTVHRGTEFGNKKTVICENAFIMAYTHVAHDCWIGKNTVIANAVQFAGHVEVGDFVVMGGFCAVVQFCRVGSHCFVGGGSVLRKDLPPFLLGKGPEFQVQGVNVVGLSRRGFSKESISSIKHVFKTFYYEGLTVSQATERMIQEPSRTLEVEHFIEFIRSSKAGILR